MDPERDDAASRSEASTEASGDGSTQQARAEAAIRRITREGADPAAEAFALANRFTDEHTSKLARWWRRRRHRD